MKSTMKKRLIMAIITGCLALSGCPNVFTVLGGSGSGGGNGGGGYNPSGGSQQQTKRAISAALAGTPVRLRYRVGEAFDLTGLTLTITYDDGTSASGIPVTASMLRPTDWNAATGTGKTLTVTTGGINASPDITNVTVQTPVSATLNITSRLKYGIGEDFDLTGLTLDITYDAGAPDLGVPVTASMLSPADWNTSAGTGKTLTVTTGGIDATPVIHSIEVAKIIGKRGSAAPYAWTGYDSLQNAIAGQAGQTAEITLWGDESIGSGNTPLNIVSPADITLRGGGQRRTITNSNNSTNIATGGTALYVSSGGKLTLKDNLTLQDDGSSKLRAMVQVSGSGSTLVMEDGAILTGHSSIYGAVSVSSSGSFTMNGGSITGNGSSSNENRATGGIRVEGGVFTMKGGSITGNNLYNGKAWDVSIYYNASFNLQGNAAIGTLSLSSSNGSTPGTSAVTLTGTWSGTTRLSLDSLSGGVDTNPVSPAAWTGKTAIQGSGYTVTAADIAKFTPVNFYCNGATAPINNTHFIGDGTNGGLMGVVTLRP